MLQEAGALVGGKAGHSASLASCPGNSPTLHSCFEVREK